MFFFSSYVFFLNKRVFEFLFVPPPTQNLLRRHMIASDDETFYYKRKNPIFTKEGNFNVRNKFTFKLKAKKWKKNIYRHYDGKEREIFVLFCHVHFSNGKKSVIFFFFLKCKDTAY